MILMHYHLSGAIREMAIATGMLKVTEIKVAEKLRIGL
jgi:hypothetical protein